LLGHGCVPFVHIWQALSIDLRRRLHADERKCSGIAGVDRIVRQNAYATWSEESSHVWNDEVLFAVAIDVRGGDSTEEFTYSMTHAF
jgi:hypothetical protein